jgi:arsenate reductase (thioredoxin)
LIQTPKKRVLFVCVGNSCRSQMAEGFARTYGSDAMLAASAGLTPATGIAPDTVRAMLEKNIDLRDQFPKSLWLMGKAAEFDLIVNMSGSYLPGTFRARIVDWEVPDPIAMDYARHCKVRDLIERSVMSLILELRRDPGPQFRSQGSSQLEP